MQLPGGLRLSSDGHGSGSRWLALLSCPARRGACRRHQAPPRVRALFAAASALPIRQALNLMCNHLKKLPPEIGGLTRLRILGLKSNRLAQLPPSFTQLKSLVELFLTDNRLTTLPQGAER